MLALSIVITVDVEHPSRPHGDAVGTLSDLVGLADEFGQPINWFIQGRWALAYPDLVARLVDRGDEVGLHGHSHVDSRRLSIDGLREETLEGQAALRAAAPGARIRDCRLPYGRGTDGPGVRALLEDELGLRPVGWDYSSFDWDENLDSADVLSRLNPCVETGGVTLMHAWPRRSPRILEELLRTMKRAGRDAARLSEARLPYFGPTGWRVSASLNDLPRPGA